jgi:hypothetical protein
MMGVRLTVGSAAMGEAATVGATPGVAFIPAVVAAEAVCAAIPWGRKTATITKTANTTAIPVPTVHFWSLFNGMLFSF